MIAFSTVSTLINFLSLKFSSSLQISVMTECGWARAILANCVYTFKAEWIGILYIPLFYVDSVACLHIFAVRCCYYGTEMHPFFIPWSCQPDDAPYFSWASYLWPSLHGRLYLGKCLSFYFVLFVIIKKQKTDRKSVV